MPTIVSPVDYRKAIASRPIVVTHFFADWCQPCAELKPQLEIFEKQFPQVLFLQVDVDAAEELAANQRIKGLPTVTFHASGQRLEASTIQGPESDRIYHTISNLTRPYDTTPKRVQFQTQESRPAQASSQPVSQARSISQPPNPTNVPNGTMRKRQVLLEKPAAQPAPLAQETSRVIEIQSMQQYTDEVSTAPNLVVIDFNASWCIPCRQIKPFFHHLAQIYAEVKFLSVDVDRCPDLASAMEIKSLPTFMIGAQQTQKEMFVGADTAYLEERIRFWRTN